MVMGLRPGAQPAPGDPSKPLLDSPCQGTSAFGSRSTRSAAAEDLACAAAWEAGRSIREEREIRIVDHLDSARPHKGDPGSDPLNSLFADTRLGGDKLSTLKNATVDEVKTNLWDNPEGRAAAIAFLGATLGILAATALSYAWTTAEASETARERIVPHPSEATGVPLATGANVPNMKLADEVDTQHDKNRAIPAATTLLLQRLASGFRRSDRSNKGD